MSLIPPSDRPPAEPPPLPGPTPESNPYHQSFYPSYPALPSPPAPPDGWQGYAPTYSPPPETAAAQIGPERVPWHWYDLIVPALPLILGLLATIVGGVRGAGSTTTTNLTTEQRQNLLILNFVVEAGVYAFILGMIYLFALKKYRVGWSALGVRRVPGRYFAAMLPAPGVMYFVAAIVSYVVQLLFFGKDVKNPQIEGLTGGGGFSWLGLILSLLTASIIAPVVEELFFRGMLYGLLRSRWRGVLLPVVADGALFSAAHGIPLILASIFVVGVTLAYIYERTKSTLCTMMVHSLFNTIGVLAVFVELAQKGHL